jgi:hypothetical protein
VTFLLLNLHTTRTTIGLPTAAATAAVSSSSGSSSSSSSSSSQNLAKLSREEYHMEAAPQPGVNLTSRLRTRRVLLNGAPLETTGNTFPAVTPKHVTVRKTPLFFSRLSLAYVCPEPVLAR